MKRKLLLAPAIGGVPEVFTDGEQGFYWPLDNPAEGARRLVAVLEDEAVYARLSQSARQRFESSFSAAKVAPRLREFLFEVAHQTPKTRALTHAEPA